MTWLIVRIEPRANDWMPNRDREPVIAQFQKKARKTVVGDNVCRTQAPQLAAKHGFKLETNGHHAGMPYVAYVYTSPSRDGVGRAGSTLHRWACGPLEPEVAK